MAAARAGQDGVAQPSEADPVHQRNHIGIYRSAEPGFPPMPVTE
jgi:hypothetical protein